MTFANPTSLDRFWSSFRSLLRLELAQHALLGTYEYRIVASDGTTVDCVPTDATVGLPALNALPMQSAVDGITARPASGAFCRVVFLNGDRAKPRVVGCDGPCDEVNIAGGSSGVVRVGDVVNAGYLVLTSTPPNTVAAYFPGTVIGQAAATVAAAALTPPGTVLPMNDGRTTSGSSKAVCG